MDDVSWVGRFALGLRHECDKPVVAGLNGVANPYEEAQLRGRVVEQRPDPGLTTQDETSRKDTGAPFPWRAPATSVTLVVEVDRVRDARLPFRHTPGGKS